MVRKIINMSENLAGWYENKSKELGVSQSGLMNIALSEYVRNDDVLKALPGLEKLVTELKLKEASKVEI